MQLSRSLIKSATTIDKSALIRLILNNESDAIAPNRYSVVRFPQYRIKPYPIRNSIELEELSLAEVRPS